MKIKTKQRILSSLLAVLLTNQMAAGTAFAKEASITNDNEKTDESNSSHNIENIVKDDMGESIDELSNRLYVIVKEYIKNNGLNFSEEQILEVVKSAARFYGYVFPIVQEYSNGQYKDINVYSYDQLKEIAAVAVNLYTSQLSQSLETSQNDGKIKAIANFYAYIRPSLKAMIEKQNIITENIPFFDNENVSVGMEDETFARDSVYIIEVNSVNNSDDHKYMIMTRESFSSLDKEEIKKQTRLSIEGTPLDGHIDDTREIIYESNDFKSVFKTGRNRSLSIDFILGEYYDGTKVIINSGILSETISISGDGILPTSVINGVSNYIVQVNGETKTQKRATVKSNKYVSFEEEGYTFHAYSLDQAKYFGLECVSDFVDDEEMVTTSQLAELYNHLNKQIDKSFSISKKS